MRKLLPAAAMLALAAAAPAASAAAVRLCGFPQSATEQLDLKVAQAVFQQAGLTYQQVDLAQELGRRGASAAKVGELLASRCDVFVGVPVAQKYDQLKPDAVVATPYLAAAFVKFQAPQAQLSADAHDSVAVAYKSPAQIIAAEEHDKNFDVLNDTHSVLDAVAQGKDQYGIAWYPSLVAYEMAHAPLHFKVQPTHSSISAWNLSFVTDKRHKALAQDIAQAVHKLRSDGALGRLTADWSLREASMSWHGDGAAPLDRAYLQPAVFHPGASGVMLRTADEAAAPAAAGTQGHFAQAQIEPGKKMYAAECARCHGDQLEGRTAPALRGPGFAPASGSSMTVGGIYQYMVTNMPADKPGQLKPQQYADIMAYLLHANGYEPSGQALDPKHADDDQSPFNSYVK